MYNSKIMELSVKQAEVTMNQNIGGPFGAAVVRDGSIISIASNSVLADHDPTAHAEINAIRQACKKLGTHDLTGCELYATGYPCPMCISAIIWANIRKVYYCSDVKECGEIGFRDDFIYDYIRDGCSDKKILELEHRPDPAGLELYRAYEEMEKTIY